MNLPQLLAALCKLSPVSVEVCERDGTPGGMLFDFANGKTLSVQWHRYSYSNVAYWETGDALEFECAAWDTASMVDGTFGSRRWFMPEGFGRGDDVLRVECEELAAFAYAVSEDCGF